MQVNKLMRCDLNLLICLHVLLEEQNVSRAAEQLNLSQSAVSKNLAKLRNWFNDPLFYRLSKGLAPTQKAKQLQPDIAKILKQIEGIALEQEFDPQTTAHQFRIALDESVYSLFLPNFLGKLINHNSNLTIATYPWQGSSFDELRSGGLDFGITGKELNPQDLALIMDVPQEIASIELLREDFCCLLRKGNPALSEEWGLDTYLAHRHVQVRSGVDNQDHWLLDHKLKEQGLARNITLCVPDFNSAASLTAQTDLIFTAPNNYAQQIKKQLPLEQRALPFSIPKTSYSLFWSKAHATTPANRWLKTFILSALKI